MDSPQITVVHLITLLELGGAQGNTLHTVRNLKPKFNAQLWCGEGGYWDNEAKKSLGNVRTRLYFFKTLVRPINPFKDLIALAMLYLKLHKIKPKILHTHSSKAGILGRLAGRLAGVPVIIHTFHGFGFNQEQRLTRWPFIFLEKQVAKITKKLIFVSQTNMDDARNLKIGPPEKHKLIRSGVPIKTLKEYSLKAAASYRSVLHEFGLPENARFITTVGAFKPQKNLVDFIRMAKQISEKHSDVFFFILGDGGLRKTLENLRDNLGLSNKIIMPGWREDVFKFLAISEVFVLTSLWEGLPRALVEAMVLGIPPVCYQTDGVSDLLTNCEVSPVKKHDIDTLTKNVISFLNDKELHGRVSSWVKNHIGIEFDIDYMVKQQEELYEELLREE